MDLPMFYDEHEEWNRALLLYDSVLKQINAKLEILNNEFKMEHRYNPIEHIASRIKSPQSIAKKIRHQDRELKVENIIKYINDVAGVRIICSFTSDIYQIADLIKKQNDVKVLKVKDYIMKPKPNGYMSYHMIVSIPVFLSSEVIETKAEIQIRTIAMDFWASLEHKMYYKFDGNAPDYFRSELKECADLVASLDQRMLIINERIKNYSKDEYFEPVPESYSASIKKSYGSVVEEEEEADEDETVVVDIDSYDKNQDMKDLKPAKKVKIEDDRVPFTGNIFGWERKKTDKAVAEGIT